MSSQSQFRSRWPLERVLFALAGSMTLVAAALGAFVSTWFLLLAASRRGESVAVRDCRCLSGVDRAAPHVSAALVDLPQPH